MSTFQKEWRTLWRDRRLVLALGAVMALYVAALSLSFQSYRNDYHEYASATRQARDEWLHQGTRNPHDAGHWGTFAFKAPAPLSILDRGSRDYAGDWVRLETHRQNDPQHRRAKEATGYLRLGAFSPLSVIAVLMPLVLLVIMHASVCGEDENETLALLRSTGASTQGIVNGKIAAGVAFTAAWIVPMLAISLIVVMSSGDADRATLGGFSLLSAAALVYAAAFIVMGIYISALSSNSRQSLALCFGAWTAACIVLPRMAGLASAVIAPAPSAFEFKNALDTNRDNKWNIPYRSRANFAAVYHDNEQRAMQAQGITDVKLLHVDPFGLAIEQTEEEGQRAYAQSFRIVLARFERQDLIQRFFSLLAPEIALQTLSGAVSETDLSAQLAFVDAAELYRRVVMKKLNLDLATNAMKAEGAKSSSSFMRQYEQDGAFWASFPEFQPRSRMFGEIAAPVVPDLVLLAVWCATIVVASRVAARRRWGP